MSISNKNFKKIVTTDKSRRTVMAQLKPSLSRFKGARTAAGITQHKLNCCAQTMAGAYPGLYPLEPPIDSSGRGSSEQALFNVVVGTRSDTEKGFDWVYGSARESGRIKLSTTQQGATPNFSLREESAKAYPRKSEFQVQMLEDGRLTSDTKHEHSPEAMGRYESKASKKKRKMLGIGHKRKSQLSVRKSKQARQGSNEAQDRNEAVPPLTLNI